MSTRKSDGGKGDTIRPYNKELYSKNWDAIKWETEPIEKKSIELTRRKDNVNIRSQALGINPDQVAEATRRYKHSNINVKFDPITGDAIFATRSDKKKFMKERGMHDNDEVSGGK